MFIHNKRNRAGHGRQIWHWRYCNILKCSFSSRDGEKRSLYESVNFSFESLPFFLSMKVNTFWAVILYIMNTMTLPYIFSKEDICPFYRLDILRIFRSTSFGIAPRNNKQIKSLVAWKVVYFHAAAPDTFWIACIFASLWPSLAHPFRS